MYNNQRSLFNCSAYINIYTFLNILLDQVAALFGADPKRAEEELMEVLRLEMKLANMSMSKEERRDITKLYNPRTLEDMNSAYSFLDWPKYINQILSKDIVQV